MRLTTIIRNTAIMFIALQQGWRFLHLRQKTQTKSPLKKALRSALDEDHPLTSPSLMVRTKNSSKNEMSNIQPKVKKKKEELEMAMLDLLHGDTTARWAERAIDFCTYEINNGFNKNEFKRVFRKLTEILNEEHSEGTSKLKASATTYYNSVMLNLKSKSENHSGPVF